MVGLGAMMGLLLDVDVPFLAMASSLRHVNVNLVTSAAAVVWAGLPESESNEEPEPKPKTNAYM